METKNRTDSQSNQTNERRNEMNEKQSTQQNPLGKIIAKALKDESFKKQLIADPAAVLKAEGIEVPEGKTVKVVADTESVRHVVLPAISGAVTDDMLESITAGNSQDWEMVQDDQIGFRKRGDRPR